MADEETTPEVAAAPEAVPEVAAAPEAEPEAAAAPEAEPEATAAPEAEPEAAPGAAGEEAVAIESNAETEAAAVKLQAMQRGRRARADVSAMKAEHSAKAEQAVKEAEELAAKVVEAEAEAAKAEAEVLDIEDSEETNAAAVKLQALQRGKKARADVAKLKAEKAAKDAEVLGAQVEMAEEEAEAAEEEAEAVDAAAEVVDIETSDETNAAAAKLQARQRGRKARADVAQLKAEKARKEAEAAAAKLDAAEQEGEAAAAEAEAVDIEDTEETNAAAVRLQAVQRGKKAREEVQALKAARAAAEAGVKAAEAEAAVAAAEAEEAAAEEAAAEAVDIEDSEETNAAAVKLQAVQRGKKARADVAKLRLEAAEAANAAEEARAAAEAAAAEIAALPTGPEADAAASKLQAVQRGKKARQEVAELRIAKAKAENEAAAAEIAAAEIAALPTGPEADAAALKMQAVQRGRAARAEVTRLKKEIEDKAAAAAAEATAPAEPAAEVEAAAGAPEDSEIAAAPSGAKTPRAAPAAAPVGAGPNGYYDQSAFAREVADDEHPLTSVRMFHSFGFESTKRFNLHYIAPDTLLSTVGNMVMVLDLTLMKQSYLPGFKNGVGCVAVHPSKKYFAVCEKGAGLGCPAPNVLIYEYPSLEVYRVLKGGTERAYSTAVFSNDGAKLATVGSYPDYMLTVWNWEEEATLLRAKAFSQEVFGIQFSPTFEGELQTSGTSHIRFWKMASTFTGLKLQGAIGKFGNTELSDIAGFTEFDDGKVLSGTETGNLLMWDGGLIKVEIMRPGGKPCHDGAIEVIRQDLATRRVITAGADGYVRAWEYAKLDALEAFDEGNKVFLEPLEEVLVDAGVSIKAILFEEDHWLVQDENGGLWKTALPEKKDGKHLLSGAYHSKQIMQFNAGAFSAMATCPVSHHAVTAGADGSVRLYNYRKRQFLFSRAFNSPATCMSMFPTSVDPSGRTVAVGFADGVFRVLARCEDGWKLKGVMKPHKAPVTALALSPDGTLLATGSEDKTVFFFTRQGESFVPICFTAISGSVSCLAWHSESSRLLIGCSGGEVLEMNRPPATVDSSSTFESSVPFRPYTFVKPKPPKEKKGKEEGEEGKEGEGEAGEGAEAGEGVEGEGAEGEEGKDGEDEEEGEEEEEPEEDLGPLPIRTVQYDAHFPDMFNLTVGGKGAGSIFRCSFSPEEPVVWHPTHAAPVGFLGVSSSGNYKLSGADDGSVRIQATEASSGDSSRHWHGCVHDRAVVGVACSFDDYFLLSAAADGTFFVQTIALSYDGGEPSEGDTSPVPTLAEEGKETVEDITKDSVYSIEDDKQKTEEDNLLAAAEEKKMTVREYLDKIRREFVAMLAENEALEEAERLPREDFEIDPGLRAMITEETEEKLDVAQKELAWESEKRRLTLAKLRAWFLDDVEVERIVLHSFLANKRVTSFRTARLSAKLQAEIAEVHALIDAEAAARAAAGSEEGGGAKGSGPAGGKGPSSAAAGAAVAGGAGGLADEKPVTKQDLRRLQRKKREEEWAAFNKTKPDENYENPDDVAAIDFARNNMGDFKLKTDPEYIVPEEQRVNAEKKRRQMVLLEESIHNIRMEYNRRFLALRDVKRRICSDITATNARLHEINKIVGAEQTLFEPSMRAEEEPEKREEISDAELNAHRKVVAASDAAAANKGGGFGGFGGDGAAEGGAAAGEGGAARPLVPGASSDDPRARALAAAAPSDLEVAERDALHKALRYEKDKLLREVNSTVATFDEALGELRREKFRLEADLKAADMKRLTLYQELVLLKEFEKRDNALKGKLDTKLAEKSDILSKISECQEKLEGKKDEVDKLIEKKKVILTEFDQMVEEGNAFREPLMKIFMRKIKRVKKKNKDDEDEDYDSEEEEEDEEDDDEDDEDFDDEEEAETCPPGCDQALYEKVCDLREKRLDQEDVITEFQKSIEAFKKDKDALGKKQKLIDGALKTIDSEIQEFQKEKQTKLNEIDVVVTLKMHQMEYLIAGQLPDDLSAGLVFSNGSLQRLKDRIRELVAEKAFLRRQQKELRKEHVNLSRDKKVKEGKISELEARAYDVQMLKFGQVIDLEVLDRMGANKGTEELKEALRRQEAQHARELAEWGRKIDFSTRDLSALTKENTNCLTAVAELTATQRELESTLNTTQTALFEDPVSVRARETAERDGLVGLVNSQAQEIEALKAEIQVLRHKGGQVYT